MAKSLLVPGFHVTTADHHPLLCKGPQGILVHHSNGELAEIGSVKMVELPSLGELEICRYYDIARYSKITKG